MKRFSIILLASLMLYGCTTTSIVSSWKPEGTTTLSMKKVLVVGLMGRNERELREVTEAEVAKALIDNGINAIPAVRTLGIPPKDMKSYKEIVDKELKENGYDGVMIISLISKDDDINVNAPGYRSWGYGPYWGYGGGMYGYSPAYVSITAKYSVEANLYSVNPEKLCYSVLTKSYDPSNAGSLARKFSAAIMKDMQKEGLIQIAAK